MEALGTFDISVVVQFLIALLLGALLGTERTLAHKKAGMRTYGLVSMGSCLFVVTSLIFFVTFGAAAMPELMRVIAGIITGVGFLGTGVIIFKDTELTGGLTTAAGLWVAAGIGVAVGFKLYAVAALATVLTLLTFTIFWYLENRVKDITNGHEG
ncbi:MgtC/SapB family protein [Candidatus Wolfebacteria bacterium]|nr:MgtC/SapB family protein [Candidatus Wolfebacteria bacterium]